MAHISKLEAYGSVRSDASHHPPDVNVDGEGRAIERHRHDARGALGPYLGEAREEGFDGVVSPVVDGENARTEPLADHTKRLPDTPRLPSAETTRCDRRGN